MQSQVAERANRDQTSNSVPVHGDGGVSFDVFAGSASALELQQGFARSGVGGASGFDVLQSLEIGALELMLVDASGLESRRTWGRPSDEFASTPKNGQTVSGFETLYGSPVGFEDAKWVSDHDLVFVENDSRFDEEQPNGYTEESQNREQTRQFVEVSGDQSRNNGAERDGRGSDNRVSSEAWANNVHVANYPSESNGSHLKCEETK